MFAILGALISIAFWCWFLFLVYVLLWGATGGPARERRRNEAKAQLALIEPLHHAVRTELVRARADEIIARDAAAWGA